MRIRNYLFLIPAILLAAFLMNAAEQHGQVKFGTLPLPGATVTATQGDKTFTAVTDLQGAYSFKDLPDGNWMIKVEMLCFEAIQREVAIVTDAPAPQWDLKLLPFESIQAMAPPPAPATTSAPAAISSTLAPQTAAPAPAAPKKGGRPTPPAANTASAFQRTDVNAAPAAPAPTAAAAQSSAPATPGEVAQAPSDGLLINGSVNNGASSPFGQAAAFGNNRRGPRSLYQWSIGATLQDSVLNARSFSLTGQDTPKAPSSKVQGFVNFGGPLKIPHLVPRNGPNISISYQWTRNQDGNTSPPTRMPTAEERAGDFSHTLNALGQPVSIIDPSTGQPFKDAVIPQDRISSQAQSLLRFYPLPNFKANSAYNYQIPLLGATHQDSLQVRTNKRLGRKNGVLGSFGMQSSRSDNTTVFGFLDTSSSLGMNAQANWTHNFTQRMSIDTGVQFSRSSTHFKPFFSGRENVSGEAGITGNNQDPINWGPPTLSFTSGFAQLNNRESSLAHNQTGALTSVVRWSHGSHNFTFGGDFRRQQFNQLSQQNSRGTFTFTGVAAGYDLAGFLLGIPDSSNIAFGNADKYFRGSTYAGYFSDDWRLSPSLTLNPGLRWEYSAPITELYGRLVNLDIAPGFGAIAPVVASSANGPLTGQHYPDSLLNPDKRGFQPRIGISWRPFLASSMVVRSGYGVYYDTSIYQAIANPMAQQSPLSKSLSIQNTAANPLTLANGFYAPPNVVTNTFGVDPHFRPGYSQNWYLTVQRDLPASLVMIATYLGIKGTHLQQQFLPNTYPTGAVNPCPSCPAGYRYLTSNGNSTAEKGTIQLRRRLHNGFTAQVDYTYSKLIDDASLGGAGSVTAQDWLNLSGERGRSNLDQRHLVNLTMQYTSGMGLGGGTLVSGWKGALMKDWTFLTQIKAGSGLPLTPIYPGIVGGTGASGSIRPNYSGADLYAAPNGFFLNPAALAPPTPGQWGNAGRNSIEGPAQFSLNASMQRTFRISDRVNADFRLDANNALNHVTYTSWNTTYGNPQFGLPSAPSPMRTVQTRFVVRF